ncbi:GNAT family N-acetyltransferase [Microcoleus sp. K1-B6]|uniref:GNAT family N-acetyltransferase n=1 Tax=unclassified Microcoleus TaxID=2642155 RepID=UPI002FD5E408
MSKITIAIAKNEEREAIYRLRYDIFVRETQQKSENTEEKLQDSLDAHNIYITARQDQNLIGFISITPPNPQGYSIDKYCPREALPFPFDDKLYEVRILAVSEPYRKIGLPIVLIYAAFCWIKACGGQRIMGLARDEILDIYQGIGGELMRFSISFNNVHCELLCQEVNVVSKKIKRWVRVLSKLEPHIDWQLEMPFHLEIMP